MPQESEPLPIVVEEPKKVKQSSCSRLKTKMKNMSEETVADVYGHLTMCNAIIVLVLNLILPGTGTMLAARFISTRRILIMQAQEESSKRIKTSLIFHVDQIKNRSNRLGMFQLLTFPLLLLGWLWALYTSVRIIQGVQRSNRPQ